MGKLVCIHGNIGVGKTTKIQNEFEDYIKMVEPIEEWMEQYFTKYNQAILKKDNGQTLTYADYSDIVEFQIYTTYSRVLMYQNLDPNKNYVFERSIQESFSVFCSVLKDYLPKQIWFILRDFTKQFIKLEPNFDQNIYLKEDTKTIMQRIKQRNRVGEETITEDYINQLQHYYDTFTQLNKYDNKSYNDCIYVVGSVGTGKTTFIENMKRLTKIESEPLQYWGDWLKEHLQNVQASKIGKPIDSAKTFFFQLKVLTSRLKFRKDKCIYERCILEEIHVFIPQYKHLFTETQYKILMKLYDFVQKYVIRIKQQTIFYMDTSIDKQLQNISDRNRLDEKTLYTREHLQMMKDKYDQMLKLDEFQTSRFYRIKWE